MFKAICNWFKPQKAEAKSKIPTREEMLQVFLDLCDGTLPNELGIAYQNIRETHGNNRSPFLDKMIRKQGGTLADPYCMWGMQESIDELCRYYKIDRRLVSMSIPKGGSTQTVFRTSSEAFKHQSPLQMRMVFWRQNSNPSRGHVGMVVSGLRQDSSFSTFEFNTSVTTQDEVVRDGQGAGFLSRRLNGTGTMAIIGYVDVYDAIAEVLKKQEGMI